MDAGIRAGKADHAGPPDGLGQFRRYAQPGAAGVRNQGTGCRLCREARDRLSGLRVRAVAADVKILRRQFQIRSESALDPLSPTDFGSQKSEDGKAQRDMLYG